MSPELAKRAGTLCGLAGTSDVVDAAVMASAASRGDTVLTTDYDDLARLAEVVPTVRVHRHLIVAPRTCSRSTGSVWR